MPTVSRRVSAIVLAGLTGLSAACGGSDSPAAPASTTVAASAAGSEAGSGTGSPSSTAATGATTSVQTGSGVVVAGGEVRINGSVVGSGETSGSGAIVGSGVLVTESRPVSGFNAIDVRAFGSIEVTRGDHESLEIDADDNVMALVRTEVTAGRLLIGMADGTSLRNATLRVRVSALQLDDVVLDGSPDLQIDGLAAARFGLAVRGSGDAVLRGTADDLTVDVKGSGEVDAAGLIAQRATVHVSGSGDVHVHATQSLDTSIEGSGDVTYSGSPPVVNSDVDGSGDVSAD